MNKSSPLAIWLPLIVSVPTSFVFRYIAHKLSGTTESWRSVISINMVAMVMVLYNIRQRRLVSLREIPGRVWAVALVAMMLLVMFDVVLMSR